MDVQRISLCILVICCCYIEGKATESLAVTSPGSGVMETPHLESRALSQKTHIIVVSVLGAVILLSIIGVVACYKWIASRRRAKYDQEELQEVIVRGPAEAEPLLGDGPDSIMMENIQEIVETMEESTISEETVEEKTQPENIEKDAKKTSRLKRLKKWLRKKVKKNKKKKENLRADRFLP